MGYSFMSVTKIKSTKQMMNMFNHNYRQMEVENADPTLSFLNEELVKLQEKNYVEACQKRLEELENYKNGSKKVRSNSVLALEVVTTFSREDREKIDLESWKKDNVAWLNKAFNMREDLYGNNVLSVMYHGDESGNVHCHAFIQPINDKGNLVASDFLGGPQQMRELQDSYGKMMSERHGLKRGLEGSVAKHSDIKKYYTQLNRAVSPTLPVYDKADTFQSYQEKMKDYVESIQLKTLQIQNEKEREVVEARTEQKRLAHELKQKEREINRLTRDIADKKREEEELVREFGPMEEIRSKLRTTDELNYALKNHPDDELSTEVIGHVNSMVMWAREQKKKQAERGKTIYDKS